MTTTTVKATTCLRDRLGSTGAFHLPVFADQFRPTLTPEQAKAEAPFDDVFARNFDR